jgi:hypothetical protein
MTIAPTVTPIIAPVERLDFAVVVLPPVPSDVELPELVVPPVGVTVPDT